MGSSFFSPRTLKEALRLKNFLDTKGIFPTGSPIGILHHQRLDSILSKQSLVPYLRSNKFPRESILTYEYRPVAPRLKAKVKRALKRPSSNLYSN